MSVESYAKVLDLDINTETCPFVIKIPEVTHNCGANDFKYEVVLESEN